jgi:hypothetical protein
MADFFIDTWGATVHRVAISNHRLVSFVDVQVTFRWRDSAHHNQRKLMALPVDRFLRRFVLHLLPDGFVRIRNFGFLANRKRATTLPLCFRCSLPPSNRKPDKIPPAVRTHATLGLGPTVAARWCSSKRLTTAEIQLRSPPTVTAAA